MDEVIEEASKKYQGLVPLVYDIETMGLDEARPQDMPYAVYLKREADKVIAEKAKVIAELKSDIADLRDDKKSTDAILDERNAEIAELKADKTFVFGEECEAYKKSEADKVIADKDKTIAELKEQVSEERSAKVNYKISANDMSDGLKKAYEEIKRHTYKRCLDKAKWCDERIARYTLQQEIQGISWQKEIKFYRRLKDKFIEISKRFEAPKLEASND